MCLVVTCLLHISQNDRDLLCATAATVGVANGYPKTHSKWAWKDDPGEENSPAPPTRPQSNLHPFKHKSGALHRAIPAPKKQ